MIEETTAPISAVVKSPDRIRDLTTGKLREVDASIRYRLGTTEILITIECRKRKRTADDTWIEQLATKRQKLGAAKTIAVSEKGFTKAASITAGHHGIELRTLSEITPQAVAEWLRPEGAIHIIPQTGNLSCSVRVEGIAEYVELSDVWERRFFHDLVQSPFPAMDLWAFHEMAHPRRFANLPWDGSVTRVQFDIAADDPLLIPLPSGSPRKVAPYLTFDYEGARMIVTEIRISADVSIHIISTEPSTSAYHSYEGTKGSIAQHARFQGNAFGLPVTLDLATQGQDVSGYAVFPSGARVGLSWMAESLSSYPSRGFCAFCSRQSVMEPQYVLPDFLVPSGIKAKERFLCSACAQPFRQWDAYTGEVWKRLPHDLTGTLHGAFGLGPIDETEIKLWLLSLLWRMGCSVALKSVDLGKDRDLIRKLLEARDVSRPGQFPAVCTALSCEGTRLEFFYPPTWSQIDGQRVLSVVFQGVLFQFLLGEDNSGGHQLVSDSTWTFPIIDWREVPFLVEAALENRRRQKIDRVLPNPP